MAGPRVAEFPRVAEIFLVPRVLWDRRVAEFPRIEPSRTFRTPQRRHVGHSNRWLGNRGASAAGFGLQFQWSGVRNWRHGRQALGILPLSVPQGHDGLIPRWS
jgi:hypothetical protein